jgi:hypothetical protein
VKRQVLIGRLLDVAAEARRRGYPLVEEAAYKELGVQRKPVERETRLKITKAS